MNNKAIINKLKEQAKALIDHMDWDDEKLRGWVDKTKIYILGLWLDKKDDNFKKEVIKMLEKYKEMVPTYENLNFYPDMKRAAEDIAKEILGIQSKLRNVLESFIEILELREKAEAEENNTPEEWKKSKTKKKSA